MKILYEWTIKLAIDELKLVVGYTIKLALKGFKDSDVAKFVWMDKGILCVINDGLIF